MNCFLCGVVLGQGVWPSFLISTWLPMGLPCPNRELLGWATLFCLARWIRMRCWILWEYFGYDVFLTIDEVVLILNGFSILYPPPGREASRKYLEALRKICPRSHIPKGNIPMVKGTICLLISLFKWLFEQKKSDLLLTIHFKLNANFTSVVKLLT